MFDGRNIVGDFPILAREVYGKRLVYLDNGATAQKPKCVIDNMAMLNGELNANIHRGVHFLSGEMTGLYEQSRKRVRALLSAKSTREIIFTSGATASINLVAYSWGNQNIKEGDNVVVSQMEHHSNIVPWQYITESKGAQLRVIPFNDEGSLMMDSLDSLIDSRTKLVCITQASNTLGTRPDLERIIASAHAVGAKVLVDGCQGVVHGGVDVTTLDCDFYALSAHKLYGPTGVGVLYGKEEILEQMPPFLYGGDMVNRVSFERTTYAELPLKFEAGTQNFIGAIGLGCAIDYLSQFNPREVELYERELYLKMADGLSSIAGLRIYGTTRDKCSLASFNVEGVHHSDIGMILDKLGIAIRTGQHCAEPTMKHFGVTGMCRASLAMYNTQDDIDALIAGVDRAVSMLR